ncbi:MAG: M28 family peptidase [Bacteroidia bacterium]|jgi:aminopeptidase YwaD|nr:M28 family peptidase [Bacteroidia bacterium]
MQRLYFLLVLLFSLGNVFAQQFFPFIAEKVGSVSQVKENLITYEDFGIKQTGSEILDSVNRWLVEYYESLGYRVLLDSFNDGSASNIIIEKQGLDTNTWIILAAHYDSHNTSYGANDNGSGVVATMEIARIIANVPTQRSVRIINFSGEEQGFVGSQHYVTNTLNPSEIVNLMLNLDQLGGTKSSDNSKIVCERDEGNKIPENDALSFLKADTLATIISQYTNLEPVIGRAYSSDYIPFEKAGYTIVGLYQESDYDAFYHSPADRVFNMDTEATEQVIKGALAATLYFAGIDLLVGVEDIATNSFHIYPNAASESFQIEGLLETVNMILSNSLGEVVMQKKVAHSMPVEISSLSNGLYTVSIYGSDNKYMRTAKLIIAR